jgi:hypothetical protein
MAIERGMARLLLAEHFERPFRGSILELGRQTISFGESHFRKWADQARVNLRDNSVLPQLSKKTLDRIQYLEMDDNRFFHLLGFDEVASCDVSSYENPTFLADLNKPVSEVFHDRFDVILDGGTMEHIFNVPACLANICAMLKIGGRVIHITPSSNMVDHGFYSFSPTLFSDYYSTNGYLVLKVSLFECISWAGEWTVFDCLGGKLDNRLGRTANAKMAGVFCVVEKTAKSTSDIAPTQSHFSHLWQEHANGHGVNRPKALTKAIKSAVPWLAEFLYWTRALAWRTSVIRRAAMPPLARKH